MFSCELSGTGESVNNKETTYIGVHYIDFFLQKGQCLAVWNRGGSVETTYVDSVLHIGVHYIDFF